MIKNFLHTMLVAGALAAVTLGLAGAAAAAPSDLSSVGSTISKLASKGYRVIVNRVGSAPLAQCTVSQVRPGQTYSRKAPGVGDDLITSVTKSVFVDVVC